MNGWFRPGSDWHLVPYWRRAHKFMSTQALTLGATVLSVLIAIGAGQTTLLIALGLTVAATLIGALVEQPEVKDDSAT
jgi:hypothetical protein